MAASASVRHGFRWDKDDFEELTNTLALNVGGWYIDLRYFLKDKKIEWAMAGKRETLSKDPRKYHQPSFHLALLFSFPLHQFPLCSETSCCTYL